MRRCAADAPAIMEDPGRRSRLVLDMLSDEELAICLWQVAGFRSHDIAQHLACSVARVEQVLATARQKIADVCVSGAVRVVDR